MKTTSILVASVLGCLSLAPGAIGQAYSIDRHSLAGGGGTSVGGSFSVSGTTGQSAAGNAQAGGSFSLASGFWPAVPTVTPPRLNAYRTNSNRLVVSWPSSATGYVLQQSAALAPASWTSPLETVTDNGTNKFILVTPSAGNRFYRLVRP